MTTVQLLIPSEYYLKDPNSSDLGKKMLKKGINLLDELGFEDFTFKKLAAQIDSTEASVYRYFENKLKFLLYLTTVYWKWIEYLIDYKTHFIKDPEERLGEVLKILTLTEGAHQLSEVSDINLKVLRRIVLTESDKTYLTKQVDEINKEGLFRGYKDLCHKIALIIEEINPDYKYPHALISTILEASNQQIYFALHLPSLTEISTKREDLEKQVNAFISETVFKLIEKN